LPYSNIYQDLVNNFKNLPGWRTRRKIVTIECDDWGGIRIPSQNVYKNLLNCGLPLDKTRFRNDTLETHEDLEELFMVLSGVKDKNGNNAVMTPVANMANPDFEKIRKTDFNEYHYEKFTTTLLKYGRGKETFNLYKEGIRKGIFVPELHGREHLNVHLWLQKLREGDKDLLIAFDNGIVTLNIQELQKAVRGLRAEFFFTSEEQKPFLVDSIKDSALLFYELFGYKPSIFVPSNGIFHPDFDAEVARTGIKFLNVNRLMPYAVDGGKLRYRVFVPGQKGPEGLTFYIRNCSFEPTEENYHSIEPTLKQIEAAFRWCKPATISTHRVNFTGAIDKMNRVKGLTELRKLLKAIVKNWPDVEFLSSGNALKIMRNKENVNS
jgi:hypothetical protein